MRLPVGIRASFGFLHHFVSYVALRSFASVFVGCSVVGAVFLQLEGLGAANLLQSLCKRKAHVGCARTGVSIEGFVGRLDAYP